MHSFLQLCILIPLIFFFFPFLVTHCECLRRAAAQLPVSSADERTKHTNVLNTVTNAVFPLGAPIGGSVLFYQVQVQLGAVSFKNKLVSLS